MDKFIERNGYTIADFNKGNFHTRPSRIIRNDYDKILDRIPDLNDISDFLQVFENSGIYITVVRHYKGIDDNEGNYDFRVLYDMFGTYCEGSNTRDFSEVNGGLYLKGSVADWTTSNDLDIRAVDNNIYTLKDLKNQLKEFYKIEDLPEIIS